MADVRRQWTAARAKVDREGRCRLWREGGCAGPLEAAHVISRAVDKTPMPGDHTYDVTGVVVVDPMRVIALCRAHHRAYDRHECDCLHVLDLEEQLVAVRDSGSVESMRRRTAPSEYRRAAA